MDQPAKILSLTNNRTLQWMQRCMEQSLDLDFYRSNSEKTLEVYSNNNSI